jgi:alcohol dehydrogenase class IV
MDHHYNLPVVINRTARIGNALGLDANQYKTLDEAATAAIKHIFNIVKGLSIPLLKDTGISKVD